MAEKTHLKLVDPETRTGENRIFDREAEDLYEVRCYCSGFLCCLSAGVFRVQTKCRRCKRIIEIFVDGDDITMLVPQVEKKA